MSNQSKHKFIWLLNTIKGLMVLEVIAKKNRDIISLVSSYTDPNVDDDYGRKIESYCKQRGIDFLHWHDLKGTLQEKIQNEQVTGIVAIGWQYLIPRINWEDLPDSLVVFHDSLLPKFRGFAPVATGMIKGEEEFGISVIFAGNSIDNGDVIIQKKIRLDSTVYIGEAMESIGNLYCDAALELISKMRLGKIESYKQDESKATYSIWRGLDDCRIDWSKSAREVYNLIRAVSHPYPGAFAFLGDKKIFIHKSEVLPEDLDFEIRQGGKIWRIDQGQPVIVCGEGLLKLLEVFDEEGRSILPMSTLRRRLA